MATQYLDFAGLTHYDGKIKEKAAGTITLEGQTVKLKAISGAVIGTFNIPRQEVGLASGTANGLMSSAHFNKLEGIATNATKVEESETNGNIKINSKEVTVYTPEKYTAHENGLYKITVTDKGAVSVATAVTKDDIVKLGIPGQDTTYELATAQKNGLMSSAQFSKLEGIQAGAQANVIEKVSVDGSPLPINSKGVNIDLSPYAKKADITGVYKFKGSVENFEALPKEGQTAGDVYDVKAAHGDNSAGTNYAWDGKQWDALGGSFHIEAIPTSTIDNLFAAA